MPRRPPRVLVAASAVLLAAVVGLWVRGQWVWDELQYSSLHGVWIIGGSCDAVHVIRIAGQNDPWEAGWEHDGWVDRGYAAPRWGHFWGIATTKASALGFSYAASAPQGTGPDPNYWFRTIVVPYWFAALLASLPLVWAFLARRRRTPPGHCRSCGYDLTANASGRCPECGAVVSRSGPLEDPA